MLGIGLILIIIIGLIYPEFALIVPLIMITALSIAYFKGRWFCSHLCVRGSFLNWLNKISRKKPAPKFMYQNWFKYTILILMMAILSIRLYYTSAILEQIGVVFIMMCIITTIIAIILGITYTPRTWCAFCPMGTMQNKIKN